MANNELVTPARCLLVVEHTCDCQQLVPSHRLEQLVGTHHRLHPTQLRSLQYDRPARVVRFHPPPVPPRDFCGVAIARIKRPSAQAYVY